LPDTTSRPAPPALRSPRLGQDGRPVRTLRRDASRNREKALCAARRLFAERGGELTMEEVAVAAGIGKGTLYRGFPSRAALAHAVLDDLARDVQGDLLRGLGVAEHGPLAVLERLLGRLHAFTAGNLDLFCVAHQDDGQYRHSPAYLWQRQAVAGLLAAAAQAGECPAVDLDAVPDAVLALLAPDLIRHQREVMGVADEDAARLVVRMLHGALA
jgi:AcrR family transcriptional regulator